MRSERSQALAVDPYHQAERRKPDSVLSRWVRLFLYQYIAFCRQRLSFCLFAGAFRRVDFFYLYSIRSFFNTTFPKRGLSYKPPEENKACLIHYTLRVAFGIFFFSEYFSLISLAFCRVISSAVFMACSGCAGVAPVVFSDCLESIRVGFFLSRSDSSIIVKKISSTKKWEKRTILMYKKIIALLVSYLCCKFLTLTL